MMKQPKILCLTALVLALSSDITLADSHLPALPAQLIVDYQLGGAYPPPVGVTAVVRDSTASPVPGMFNICYVNGFQTQPGAQWPAILLVPGPDGHPLTDPGWRDEYILDISTAKSRAENLHLLLPTLTLCAEKGFDAVEFDNLDSYTRSQTYLTLDQSIAFATLLVDTAHSLGLIAGQKNAVELGTIGRDVIGFDFAITEECDRWNECGDFTGVYGDSVIGIEYADDLRSNFADACESPDRPRSLILRDRMLVPQGQPDYIFEACKGGGENP